MSAATFIAMDPYTLTDSPITLTYSPPAAMPVQIYLFFFSPHFHNQSTCTATQNTKQTKEKKKKQNKNRVEKMLHTLSHQQQRL